MPTRRSTERIRDALFPRPQCGARMERVSRRHLSVRMPRAMGGGGAGRRAQGAGPCVSAVCSVLGVSYAGGGWVPDSRLEERLLGTAANPQPLHYPSAPCPTPFLLASLAPRHRPSSHPSYRAAAGRCHSSSSPPSSLAPRHSRLPPIPSPTIVIAPRTRDCQSHQLPAPRRHPRTALQQAAAHPRLPQ